MIAAAASTLQKYFALNSLQVILCLQKGSSFELGHLDVRCGTLGKKKNFLYEFNTASISVTSRLQA